MPDQQPPLTLGTTCILVGFLWLLSAVVLLYVDTAMKGVPTAPTKSEERRLIPLFAARLSVASIAIYLLNATPDGLWFWLLNLCLGAPAIWWPATLFKLGAYRAAAFAGFCAGPLLSRVADQHERTFFLTLASIHQPDGWLARRADALLTGERRTPRGGELAARAVLALRDGQLEEARLLFELVAGLSPVLASQALRVHCHHFLLADAALRGNWNEVQVRCQRGFRTPTAATFAHAARLRDGYPTLSQWLRGVFALVFTPHRIRAWRMYQWARRERAVARASQPASPGADAPLPERLHALATFLQMSPGRQRADELSLRVGALREDSDPVLQNQLGLELRMALAQHIEASWYAPEDLASLGNVATDAQMSAMDEVERLRDALRHGCDIKDMASCERWRLWAKLRAKLDAAWRLGAEPESTFESVVVELISISATLWNECGEPALAHEIGRFLDRHRELTQNTTRRELIQSNQNRMGRP